MLKERIKKLLIYCVIFSMVMQSLLYTPIISHAMTPGEETKEIELTLGETILIDTRYDYKIKKSEFIEFWKSHLEMNSLRAYNPSTSSYDKITNLEQVDWNNISEYIFNISSIGYSCTYNPSASNGLHIFATEENEYLVFNFYDKRHGMELLVNELTCEKGSKQARPICTYDAQNNRLIIELYTSSAPNGFNGIDNYDDVNFKYMSTLNIGQEIYPNEVIIHGYYDCDIKIVDNEINEFDLTNTCYIEKDVGHIGISSDKVNYFFKFNDAYSKYTLIDVSKNENGKNELTFAVDSNRSDDYIYYVDYFTSDIVYKDDISNGTTPTIYTDTTGIYDIWINSNTNTILQEKDLEGGMIVFGFPNNIDVDVEDYINPSMYECTQWCLLNSNKINNFDDINYELQRNSTFNINDYQIINLGDTLYKKNIFTAKELRPYYYWKIYTYINSIEANIYDGATGQLASTQDKVAWSLSTINGIDISSNVSKFGLIKEDSLKYALQISNEDKEIYPNLFVPNLNYFKKYINIYEPYNNQTYTQDYVKSAINIINATANGNLPTCTQEGNKNYSISYDFSGNKYFKEKKNILEKEASNRGTSYISNNNVTSLSTHNDSDEKYVYFDTIESFDELANPFLLEKYGIRQYESLYIIGRYDYNIFLEIYPTYENGETYYNIYNNGNTLKFNVNSTEDIIKYNNWVNSLAKEEATNKRFLRYIMNYDATYYMTANRDNPYHTFPDSVLEAQVNAMTFNLNGENDGTTTVPSTFLKTSDNDKLYVEGIVFHSGGNYTLSTTTDALGHIWTDTSWQEINRENISNNTDIINANNNVTNLDTLLEYAENDVDKTLLNSSNNKLYYRLCNRAGDAYELEIRHTHNYGTPTFTWNNDYSNCEASFTCTSSDVTETRNCTITSSRTESKCTVDGKIVYTATVEFNGNTYTDTKEVTLSQNGHNYDEPTFTWDSNYDCIATFECIKGDDTKTIDCIVTTTETNSSCTTGGTITYVATVTFEGKTYSDTTSKDKNPLNHEYGLPTFVWDNEYNCVATFKCVRNDDAKTLDCIITSNTTNSTCTVDGKTIYTATVTFDGKTYTDTKEVVIGASGHIYSYLTFTWDKENNCKATFVCQKNDDTQVLGCTVTSKITNPLCIIKGKIIYTAKVTFESNEYTDIKEVDIIPNGHKYKEPVFTWNEDYSDCIATFECKSDDDVKTVDCTITSNTTKATCTIDGKTIYIATVTFENVTYKDTKEIIIKALDHEFGPWHEAKAPTYDEEGVLQRDCIRNDISEKKAIDKLIKPIEKPVEPPTEPSSEQPTKQPTTEEITTKEPTTEETTTEKPTEQSTEQPTEPVAPPTTEESTTEELTTEEETTKNEVSSVDKITPPVKDQKKSSEGGINPLSWLAAILVGTGIILVLMSRKKLFIYDYIFELYEKDEYKGKTIRDARIVIAIKPYKETSEVKLKKEPFIKENPDVRLSDIVKVSLNDDRLPVLEKNLEIEQIFKDIYGWDCVEFEVIGYALGYEGTLTAKEYRNTPEELRDLTVVDVMKASKLEFEAVARGRLMGFDGNIQASTMSIE